MMLYGLAFATLVLLLGGLFLAKADRRQVRPVDIRRRLQRVVSDPVEVDEDSSILRPAEGGAIGLLPQLRSLELLLQRAGMPLRLNEFLLVSLLFAAIGLGVGTLALRSVPAGIGLVSAGLLPLAYVGVRKRKRMRLFEEQFPEALELFTRSLRAGHSMTMGFQMVGEELPDPVGTEFAQVEREISFGLETRVALANLQDRVDVSDVPFFAVAVLVQQETGGNLVEILDNLTQVIRERLKFHGKVRALTAQSQMSANILAVVPFVMLSLMYLMNPSYIAPLWETRSGHIMAGVGAVMIVVGYALCKRLAVVRV